MFIAAFIIITNNQGNDIEAAVEAIQRLEKGLNRTGAAGNVEGNISAYTNDAVCMLPNAPTINGKKAFRAFMTTSFDQFIFESKHSLDKIDIVGDWALVPGICKGTIMPKSGVKIKKKDTQ